MKVFSLALLLQLATVEGFTTSIRVVPSTAVGHSLLSLNHHLGDVEHDAALPKEDDSVVVFDNVAVALDNDAWKTAMKVVAALTLAAMSWGVATTPPAFAAEDNSSFLTSSTSVVLSAGASVKDGDIVDFSMPSYESATRAEVNSNLKGDKYLLGEASKTYGNKSSSSSSEAVVVEKKAEVVVDVKAEKEAAKAARNAARAKQQADIDVAAKAAAAAAAN